MQRCALASSDALQHYTFHEFIHNMYECDVIQISMSTESCTCTSMTLEIHNMGVIPKM